MKIKLGRFPSFESGKERKIEIKIDPWDTWNMDHTLSLIIHPMLIQLKETKHGTPFVDDEDVPEDIRSTAAPEKINEWDIDDNFDARWTWVLDEMISTFGEISNSCWESKSVFDIEKYNSYCARIDNGLRLFGKYFRALWD